MPTVINENDEYVLRREYMGRRHGGYWFELIERATGNVQIIRNEDACFMESFELMQDLIGLFKNVKQVPMYKASAFKLPSTNKTYWTYSLNGQEESADYECETKQEAEQFLYNDLEAECLNNGDLSGEWTAWIQEINADTGEVIRHYEYTAIYEKEPFEKPYLQSEFI